MITFVSLAVPQVSLIESGQPLLGNYTIAMLMLWLGTEGFFGDLFTGFSSYYTCLTSEATKAPKKESIPAWIKLDVQATGEIPHKGLRSTRIGFVCYWNETSSTLFENPFCYFGQQKHLRYLRLMSGWGALILLNLGSLASRGFLIWRSWQFLLGATMSRIYLHQAAEEKIFDSESSWARLGLLLIFCRKGENFFQKRNVPLWKAPTAKIAALRPNPNALTQGPIPEKRRAEAWTRTAFSCDHEWIPLIFLYLTANQEQLTGDRVLTLCWWIGGLYSHWSNSMGYSRKSWFNRV